ncbi:MAG: CAP domain-containing protein [Pseudomonadota bacterium]
MIARLVSAALAYQGLYALASEDYSAGQEHLLLASEDSDHDRSLGSWRYRLFQPESLSEFEQTILDALNAVRASVDPPADPAIPPIIWDRDAATVAQNWVDGCVYDFNSDASEEYDLLAGDGDDVVPFIGELIARRIFISTPRAPDFVAGVAASLWEASSQFYDYETNTCTDNECLNYTQVVWRNTTSVGCAVATCFDDSFNFQFVSCNFVPGGNFRNQRPY